MCELGTTVDFFFKFWVSFLSNYFRGSSNLTKNVVKNGEMGFLIDECISIVTKEIVGYTVNQYVSLLQVNRPVLGIS
jgi:hypothetical protein